MLVLHTVQKLYAEVSQGFAIQWRQTDDFRLMASAFLFYAHITLAKLVIFTHIGHRTECKAHNVAYYYLYTVVIIVAYYSLYTAGIIVAYYNLY